MYTPQTFDVQHRTKLQRFIQQHSIATVVSVNDSLQAASHLSLLFDDQTGEHGTLTGHMAKVNSQWKTAASQSVMCIFHGPHPYI